MPPKPKRAQIKILKGRRAGETLEVMFNPTEYTHEWSNNFQETSLPGLNNPILQFINGETQTVTMELMFDTWTYGGGADVTEKTREFSSLLAIDGSLHAPPPVEFKWGDGAFRFEAVLQSLSQRFTMFKSDGKPVRAVLSVTFKQFRSIADQLNDPKRESPDRTKRRVLTADSSLWMLAAKEYGRPADWRRIAKRNRIADPLRLRPGALLYLPPVELDDA